MNNDSIFYCVTMNTLYYLPIRLLSQSQTVVKRKQKTFYGLRLAEIYCDDHSSLSQLHCTSLLRTIFASLARAHERVHVQNVRDFPQTKLDSEINAPFLLNEHGDPRLFFQVFAKNS